MPTRQVALRSALLVVLVALVVIGLRSPGAAIGGVHPVTPLVVAGYVVGLVASRRLGRADEVEGRQGGRPDAPG